MDEPFVALDAYVNETRPVGQISYLTKLLGDWADNI